MVIVVGANEGVFDVFCVGSTVGGIVDGSMVVGSAVVETGVMVGGGCEVREGAVVVGGPNVGNGVVGGGGGGTVAGGSPVVCGGVIVGEGDFLSDFLEALDELLFAALLLILFLLDNPFPCLVL